MINSLLLTLVVEVCGGVREIIKNSTQSTGKRQEGLRRGCHPSCPQVTFDWTRWRSVSTFH